MPRRKILLVANGDLRPSANKKCWPAQAAMEEALTATCSARLRVLQCVESGGVS